ncbi:hypothetical protein HRW14_24480 [Streptomyces lunaelactis]|uniref:DUF6884 domain-containing protein n=1 Tax=Streptomyces lunaelactis TaxID=1535768 RepID=UPI0015853C39|nr:DUF6884 domain-containing protein [Streptomyces lunaelactis]NUK53372.1 hypothetical protein [Streptomyces lunaelactis]
MNTTPVIAAGGPVVVVPCSAAKLVTTVPVPAADLYVGPFHRLCRRAAHAIAGSAGTVLVLSAANGFVTLDELLAPYELRMGEAGCVRPDQLRAQAERLGLGRARQLVALGGRAYVDAVAAVRPDVLRPLTGCRGIGQQRARLCRIAAAEQPLLLAQEFSGRVRPGECETASTGHDGRGRQRLGDEGASTCGGGAPPQGPSTSTPR